MDAEAQDDSRALLTIFADTRYEVPSSLRDEAKRRLATGVTASDYPPDVDRFVRRLLTMSPLAVDLRQQLGAHVMSLLADNDIPWQLASLFEALDRVGVDLAPREVDQLSLIISKLFRQTDRLEDAQHLARCASYLGDRFPENRSRELIEHLSSLCPWAASEAFIKDMDAPMQVARIIRSIPHHESRPDLAVRLRTKCVHDLLQFAPSLDKKAHTLREADDAGMSVVLLHRYAGAIGELPAADDASTNELVRVIIELLAKDWIPEDREKTVAALRLIFPALPVDACFFLSKANLLLFKW
jgi:hypothetical protein